MANPKTKSKSHIELVRHWELSPIGRRILREGRQFATVRRIVVAARKVLPPSAELITLQIRSVPASLAEYTGAPRPPDSSLNCGKAQKHLSFPLPGLSEWLAANPNESF